METRYKARTENYIHRTIAGSDVLVSVGANVARFNGYIELNPAAAVIWEALKEPCTAEDLSDALAEAFGLDRSVASADAAEFLKELLENDMVTAV